MAVNFLDGITVDSGTGSAPTIIAAGTRPVTITGSAIGSVAIGGSNGGWATGYFFTGYSGTNRGGFGALGSVDTLSYYWIGDAYNDTTMVVQPNAGNVGIGTTSPSTKLHISAASSNSQLTLERTGSATGKWSIHTNTDNLFFNNSAGSNRLVILNSGSVGIGTSTPTERLHVKTSGVEVAKYETTATADLAIELANSQGSMFFGLGGGEQFGIGTTSDLNGTGNLFIIEQGGNVGIGTTSPSQKLTVNGTIMSTGASNPQLILQDNTHSDITIKGDSGIFSVTNQSVGQNITMLYNGNIGIGTTAPTSNLHILGSASPSYQLDVSRDNDGTGGPNIKLFHSTVSPSTSDAAGSIYFAESKTGAQATEVTYGRISVLPSSVTSNAEGGVMTFALADGVDASVDEAMRITQDGKVGIGTTSPGAKLEINDAIAPKMRFGRSSSYYWDIGHTASDFQIQSQSGGTIMHLNYDGNVGVGTTSPSEKLQVNGTVRATSYKSSDGSAGVTATFTVRNGNNSAALTLTVKNGIITSVSSDRRLKENITLIGTSDSGINIYTYEYKYKFSLAGVGLFQGVMSDEVPAEAVSVDEYGYDMVDYSLIDVEFKRLSN